MINICQVYPHLYCVELDEMEKKKDKSFNLRYFAQ